MRPLTSVLTMVLYINYCKNYPMQTRVGSANQTLSVGIKYHLRDLLFDVNNYAGPTCTKQRYMRHIRYGK